jgi:predicted nuclease with RNAse H fold
MSKISKDQLAQMGGLRSRTGRNLRDVAAAAIEAAVSAKAGQQEQEARKRYVVGIDPGVKTGFAVWDRDGRRLLSVETADFWTVFFQISNAPILRPKNTLIVIEVAHYAPVFRERKAKGKNVNHAARLAQNVGQVMREAKLLAEGLRRLGYEVVEQKPLGKAKKAADDVAQFQRLTGWTERTSQHARDAARMVFEG